MEMSDRIFILFHFIGLTIVCFCHVSLSLYICIYIFDMYSYSFQHSNYVSCRYGKKSNNASMGEVTTKNTSVVLKDLLPYSWYNVEVAAYTIEYGRAANVIERTMELGKLF